MTEKIAVRLPSSVVRRKQKTASGIERRFDLYNANRCSLRSHYRDQVRWVGSLELPSQPGITELPGDHFRFRILDFRFQMYD